MAFFAQLSQRRLSRSRRGFTLIELLVVIAIIGVLVGLLLPAVQAAREAARRSSCVNNVKQLALAIHNFHDAKRTVPSGCTGGQNGSTALNWGHSWVVDLLPFMEESASYDRLSFTYGNYGLNGANYSNVVAKMPMSGVFCPSSPLPRKAFGAANDGTANGVATNSYVGISGASTEIIPNPSPARTTDATRRWDSSLGRVSGGGMLIPHGAKPSKGPRIRFDIVTDGLSKTMMISECSDFLTDTSGNQVNWYSGAWWGWFRGCESRTANPSGSNNTAINWTPPDRGSSGGNGRTCNLTTVRYSINDKYNVPNNAGQGRAPDGQGNQMPLNSAHGGGVVAAMGDGSVTFLSDSTTQSVLCGLTLRDDGMVVSQ